MTNKALVEALRDLPVYQNWTDKFGDGRRAYLLSDDLHNQLLSALASSGNEAPGGDKGLVERLRNEAPLVLKMARNTAKIYTQVSGQETPVPSTCETQLLLLEAADRLTALSSGNEVAKVVGWLREPDHGHPYAHPLCQRIADQIERGDHLASDAAPLTGGGGNG